MIFSSQKTEHLTKTEAFTERKQASTRVDRYFVVCNATATSCGITAKSAAESGKNA